MGAGDEGLYPGNHLIELVITTQWGCRYVWNVKCPLAAPIRRHARRSSMPHQTGTNLSAEIVAHPGLMKTILPTLVSRGSKRNVDCLAIPDMTDLFGSHAGRVFTALLYSGWLSHCAAIPAQHVKEVTKGSWGAHTRSAWT